MSYFAIERNNRCLSPVVLQSRNGNSDFSHFLTMTYDEMKSSESLDDFIVAAMDATNETSGTDDALTIVTLVGEGDLFVWSVIMGPGENGDIKYNLVDWKRDGKHYRYES